MPPALGLINLLTAAENTQKHFTYQIIDLLQKDVTQEPDGTDAQGKVCGKG